MGRIRVLEAVGGLDFSWLPGDLVELPDAQAEQWADGHRAEWADTPPKLAAPPPAPADEPDKDEAPQVLGPFDPAGRNAADVLAYLDTVGEEEAVRVLDAEEAGNARAGILKKRDQLVAKAQARDEEAIEVTAEQSRGGGSEVIETR